MNDTFLLNGMNEWMGDNFMEYRILGWQLFSLSTWKLSFSCLLASIIVIKMSATSEIGVPVNLCFPSGCFKNSFLSLMFYSFILIYLRMDFFSLILIGTHWGSSIWGSVSLIISGKISPIVISNISSVSFLSFISGTQVSRQMLESLYFSVS